MLFLWACVQPQNSPKLSPLHLTVEQAPADPHAVDLQVSDAATVRCVGDDDRLSIQIEERGILRGMLADTSYVCTASAEGFEDSEAVTILMPPLPADLPVPELIVHGDGGYHLLQVSVLNALDQPEVVSGRYIEVIDSKGRPRWQFPGGSGDVDVSWAGPEKVLFGGTGLDLSFPPKIVDLDGNVILETPEVVSWKDRKFGGWNHDVGLSRDGSAVLALVDEVSEDADPLAFGVLSMDPASGQVLGYLDVLQSGVAALPPPVGADPYHPNAVWDDAERIYVNLRGVSRILCFDRFSGELIWWLGMGSEFTLLDSSGNVLPDSEWFFNAHDMKVIDGMVYLFDNGSERGQVGGVPSSRVLVLKLDETAKTATIVSSWADTSGGRTRWLAPIWGGVDPIYGGLSVAVANMWWIFEAGPNASLLHLNENLEVSWRVRFADPHVALYRSEWSPFFP